MVARLLVLRRDGATLKQIGSDIGVSTMTVSRYLRKFRESDAPPPAPRPAAAEEGRR